MSTKAANSRLRHTVRVALALAACAGPHAAYSQSIDRAELEALFGEPVTMSVNGSPQRESEVPASMVIVTAEDIRRSGATDLTGVLRHVPGIDAMQWGRDHTDLSIRGSNQALSPRILVLVDGREVYAHFYGYVPWTALPVDLNSIRQIEIVKGANSALFGFNAVSGVINIVTYQPNVEPVNAASVTVGTQEWIEASGVTSLRLGESAGLRLSAGIRENDDFDAIESGLDPRLPRGNKHDHVALRGTVALSAATDLTVEVAHASSAQVDMIPTYTVMPEEARVDTAEAVLSSDTRFGVIQTRLYKNSMQVLTFVDGGADPWIFDNDVVVAQVSNLFKVGTSHIFRVAGEYRENSLGTTPTTGAEVFYEVSSLSGMWDWALGETVSWSNAVRYDELHLGRRGYMPPGYAFQNSDWNRDIGEMSVNSGLVWQASDQDTFRVTAARGVQVPNLTDFGGVLFTIPVPGVGVVVATGGTPYIDPATVTHLELAWGRTLNSTGGHLRVAAFHDRWDDLLTGPADPPPNSPRGAWNIGRSTAYGLDLSIDGTFGMAEGATWTWELSYLPQWVNDDFKPGYTPEAMLIDYENSTARHTVDGRLGWARGPWEIDGYLEYKSGAKGLRGIGGAVPTAILVEVPAYVTMDARIGYAVTPSVTLAVAGQNLLHDQQRQTAVAEVERQVNATLSVKF